MSLGTALWKLKQSLVTNVDLKVISPEIVPIALLLEEEEEEEVQAQEAQSVIVAEKLVILHVHAQIRRVAEAEAAAMEEASAVEAKRPAILAEALVICPAIAFKVPSATTALA